MHRSYAPPESWYDDVVELPSDEGRHVRTVLRMHEGDALEVFDGVGRVATGVVSYTRERVCITVTGELTSTTSPVRIELIQALPKGKRMDLIVEKCTEIGVDVIHPVVTDRCIVQLAGRQLVERTARWQRIAEGAAKQCKRPRIPEIRELRKLSTVIEEERFDTVLAGVVAPGLPSLHETIAAMHADTVGARVALVIGPEGDFSESELAEMQNAGVKGITFGTPTLRTETAAIFGVSVLVYEFMTQSLVASNRVVNP